MHHSCLAVCFSLAILISIESSAYGQCFSDNDNALSESTSSSVSQLLDGFTDFAVNLFKNVIEKDGGNTSDNVFISPISVWSALTATYLGAKNQTASELAHVLGIGDVDKVGVANAYKVLKIWYYLRTENQEANYTFRMANKLFFQEEEPIRPCMMKQFQSEIKKVNFAQNPEAARSVINRWVEQQTSNKIKDLVPAGYVDQTTRMILVNAAYFKGDWQAEFDPENTEEEDFFITLSKSIEVEMMRQSGSFQYAKNTILGCAAIELPYSGKELSMFVLLPYKNESAEQVVSRLSGNALMDLFSRMIPVDISLALPKFHVEQTIDLKDRIEDLGVHDLFDPMHADLSGFTGEADFAIGNVRHKTYIKVNEEGTEAAAATSLISFRKGNFAEPFTVNRPFVFLIRDNILDTILFIGLIRNPEE